MKKDPISAIASVFLAIVFVMADVTPGLLAASNFPTRQYSNYSPRSGEVTNQSSTSVVKRVSEKNLDKDSKKSGSKIEYIPMSTEAILGTTADRPLLDPSDDFIKIELDMEAHLKPYQYLQFEWSDQSSTIGILLNDHIPVRLRSKSIPESKVIIDLSQCLKGETLESISLSNGSKSYKVDRISDLKIVASDYPLQTAEIEVVNWSSADQSVFRLTESNDNWSVYKLNVLDMPSIPQSIRMISSGSAGFTVIAAKDTITSITMGLNFLKNSNVKLTDIELYYFNKKGKKWQSAPITNVDHVNNAIDGKVPTNTQYFAGLIKTPDMPEVNGYAPTTVTDIKAANPAEGMTFIQPPKPSRTGDANLSFPIQVPPGRKGMTPQVAISYNSNGGSSWVGYGWSLSVPSVSISTKWGVPTFPNTENEVYQLKGEELIMEGDHKANRYQTDGQGNPIAHSTRSTGDVKFFTKTMSSYKEIIRKGSSTSSYIWYEKDGQGKRWLYGTDDISNYTINSDYLITNSSGDVVEWLLAVEIDKWGNTIRYEYDKATVSGTSSIKHGGTRYHLSKITYTGHNQTSGKYSISFETSFTRPDARVNYNTSAKIVDDVQLDEIVVKYNSTVVKEYEFNYTTSRYYHNLLESIEEHRSGQFFYEQQFSYYDKDISYGAPQVIPYDSYDIGIFDGLEDDGDAKGIKGSVSKEEGPSPIKTTSTKGLGGSLNIGLGWEPGLIPGMSRGFTFSGKVGASGSKSKDKNSLQDVNGDGLPDMVINNGRSIKYFPLEIDASGNFQFGMPLRINYGDGIFQNQSSTFNYGYDFTLPLGSIYRGVNWNETTSKTSKYVTEYNGDGIMDVVVPSGASYNVLFGKKNSYGDINFVSSSENTANPVVKKTAVIPEQPKESTKNFEIVRTWKAPVGGTISITGDVIYPTGIDGEMEIAIQKNDGFLNGWDWVSSNPTAGLTISESETVNPGDLILFRLRAGDDGQNDLIKWNPTISYTSYDDGHSNLKDGNGTDYGSSNYKDAFLLSAAEGVLIAEDQSFRIYWDPVSLSGMSDDMVFEVQVYELDGATGDGDFTDIYEYKLAAGTSATMNPGDLTKRGGGSVPSIFGSATQGTVGSANDKKSYIFTFHVKSSSNIDWREIDWRPVVEIVENCPRTIVPKYPTVKYHTFNRLAEYAGPYSVTGTPGSGSDPLRAWPNLSFTYSDFETIFGAYLGASTTVYRKAYFVTKSGEELLSKIALKFDNQGNLSYYLVNDDLSLGSTTSKLATGTANTFNANDVIDETLHFEFFADDANLATFLIEQLASISYFAPSNSTGSQTAYEYNIFNEDNNYLQDVLLHWGSFGWSDEATDPLAIGVSELKPAHEGVANNNDFSSGQVSQSQLSSVFSSNESSLNPRDQKFFVTTPIRDELERGLRDYILTYSTNSYALDRWSVMGSYMGAYRLDGVSTPGLLGEIQEQSPSTPITSDPYSAFATLRSSFDYNKGLTVGATLELPFLPAANVATSYSDEELNNATLNSFQDFNGDNYPDILEGVSSFKVYASNPTGGHEGSSTLSASNTDINHTYTDNSASLSFSGRFVNDDARFNNLGLSGSTGYGESYTQLDLRDINGDGLPDRIVYNENESNYEIQLGKGYGFEVSKTYDQLEEARSKNYTQSVGFNLGSSNQSTGKSFSGGVGVNRAGSQSKDVDIDLNGDGLSDILSYDGTNFSLMINTGTNYQAYTLTQANLSDVSTLNDAQSLGISVNLSGSFSVPLVPTLVANLKLSVTGSGSFNYSVNKVKSSFMDFNNDGLLDFVRTNNDDDLEVLLAEHGKADKLKSIENPLGGSITLDYEQIGNKIGFFPIQVRVHNEDDNDAMYWDMPNASWVMSQVTINDGMNLVRDPNGDDEDMDGEDAIVYKYQYDGGVKSRRERKFVGFSRVETIEPSTDDDVLVGCENADETKEFITYVDEYHRLDGSDFQDLVEAHYMEGILLTRYKVYNIQECNLQTNPSSVTHLREQLSRTHNTYEFYPVDQSYEVSYTSQVDLNQVEEVDVLFPALLETETISVPQKAEPEKFHAYKREFEYDRFFNMIKAQEKAGIPNGTPSVTTTSTSYPVYEYETRELCAVDLYNGSVSGVTELVGYGSSLEKCFRVDLAGYSSDTVCVSTFDITPCAPYTGASCDPGVYQLIITSYHRKQSTFNVVQSWVSYPTISNGAIIAAMTYYSPGSAGNRTNEIKSHKIYLGTEIADSLYRHTESKLGANAKAPYAIWNYNEDKHDGGAILISKTDLEYDIYGNVDKITYPLDANSERTVIEYTYDSNVHTYVTNVENTSLDLNMCMAYDMATGNLLKKVDPNDNPTRYVYDDFYRLKEFYAPYELFDGDRAATISFEYYPSGMGSHSFPVAITNHNINGSGLTTVDPLPKTTYDQNCAVQNFRNLTNRPAMVDPLQTATFMDGVQRVVQIKKDQPWDDGTSSHTNERVREVSGITQYNKEGQVIAERNSFLEMNPTSSNLGELIIEDSDLLMSAPTFDYQNRLIEQTLHQDNGDATQQYNYEWLTYGSEDLFAIRNELKAGSVIISKSINYINLYGQTVASSQYFTSSDKATTEFVRNPLDELKSVTDPIGLKTFYKYDDFGQMIQENHPDKGITKYYYDKAGNNIKVESPATGTTGINMTYKFNRLSYVERPKTNHIHFVKYEYGEEGTDEGINAVGRVKKIYQGDPPGNPLSSNPTSPFMEEAFEYDELGNKVFEERKLRIPQVGLKSYVTEYDYDSWGRVNWIEYPDGDKVNYTYGDLGVVEKITAQVPGQSLRTVLDGQAQDGFGNTTYIKYGNGTETTFQYETITRRLSEVKLKSGSAYWLDKEYEYDLKSNVTDISNVATISSPFTTQTYTNEYTYDQANRLLTARNDYGSGGSAVTLDLDMVYLEDGAIDSKKQTDPEYAPGFVPEWEYEYDSQSHQLDKIKKKLSGSSTDYREYEYNSSGSVEEIFDITGSNPVSIEKLRWDENQVLTGVSNENGYHHYLYDHNGMRVMKSSILETTVQEGGGEEGGTALALDPYTVYVNPYYIEINYSDAFEYSKHYYNGSQRISTKQDVDEQSVSYTMDDPLINGEKDLHLFLTDFLELVEEDFVLEDLLTAPSYESYYGPSPCDNEEFYDPEDEEAIAECMCKFDPIGALLQEIDCDEYDVQYWYHPDYLGHTEIVSDANGEAYQYFWYAPFGETIVEEHANTASFSSRYLFNAKEFDPETGRYYYGARYYDPGLSIWLSVDPLAKEFPNWTPYNFNMSNPINMIDPDGKAPGWWDNMVDGVGGFFQSVVSKITGDDLFTEVLNEMKEIIQKDNDDITSPITDHVDHKELRESGSVNQKRTQNTTFFYRRGSGSEPSVVIGDEDVELVNEVYITNESNLSISYSQGQNGSKSVKYKYPAGGSKGIIRIVVPTKDPTGRGQRKTGLQLAFDISDPDQLKSFIQTNKALGGLKVVKSQ